MEARDNITHQIKEAVRKSEMRTFRSMETIWDRIEEKLDEEKQEQKKVIPFRKISIAAAILLLLSLGVMYIFQTDSIKQDDKQTYAQQENKAAKPSPEMNTAGGMAKGINTDEIMNIASATDIKPKQRSKGLQSIRGQKAIAERIDLSAINIKNQSLDNHELYIAPKTIKGRVTDEHGEAVAGAVVTVKGTNNSTLTDLNGNYEIVLRDAQKELEIRGVGLISKIIDINKSEHIFATTLETNNNEVAVISIYNQKMDKKNFTAPVSAIVSKDVSRPATDITKALEGEVPGVHITRMGARSSASDITIRGMNVPGISGSPLIVIDGTYYNGSLVSLKSDEVESLTVLKDGNATSVYGSRGANGVIIIKTKTGKGYSIPKGNVFQKMKSMFHKKDKKELNQDEE